MKITLIQCPAWTVESPPYALALLVAVLEKNGHKVDCFDLNIEMFNYCNEQIDPDYIINAESWSYDYRGHVWYNEEKVLNFMQRNSYLIGKLIDSIIGTSAQIIGFSVQSTSKFFSLELARQIKERDPAKIIVFGGFLCSKNCYGVEVLKDFDFIDYICFGEGEESFLSLVNAIENNESDFCPCGFAYRDNRGVIIEGGEGQLIADLDRIPFADFSKFTLSDYTKKILPISISRGCIKRCVFCNESVHWLKYRARSAKNILNEIEYQLVNFPHVDMFWFNDSLINGDITMLNELCDLLISRKIKIKWGGQGVVRKEMDGDLLKKMKLAGCSVISYGVENGSSKVLWLMQKGQMYSPELAESIIKDTYDIGISVIFNIIVGFPGEGEAEFKETKDFVQRCKKYAAHIELNTLLLLKGSYLYDNLDEFNIFPIDGNSDWQLKWKTNDNQNTYEIRKQKLDELMKITN